MHKLWLLLIGIFYHLKRYRPAYYWRIMIVALLTTYNIVNWDKVTDFQFFDSFDGNNLLFVVWIVVCILPILGKFKTPFLEMEEPPNYRSVVEGLKVGDAASRSMDDLEQAAEKVRGGVMDDT